MGAHSDPVFLEVCERVAGGESLRAVCRERSMPDKATFLRRVAKDPDLQDAYGLALRTRAEGYAEEIIDIADDPRLDTNEKRVRTDARKWVASKLLPKVYGDRIQVEQTTVQVKGYVCFDPKAALFADAIEAEASEAGRLPETVPQPDV